MYSYLLSSVPDNDLLDGLSADALVGYALVCRSAMLASGTDRGESAYDSLAAEVAYDRVLITLTRVHGLDAGAVNFSHPKEERARLERALAVIGIDLVALARTRGRAKPEGPVVPRRPP
jgi:hypothetical protein